MCKSAKWSTAFGGLDGGTSWVEPGFCGGRVARKDKGGGAQNY